MCLLQSTAWRNRPLCPARMWWWTAPPTPRIPTRRGSSAENCLRWENSSNPGIGGRKRPATSSRTFPEVGLAADSAAFDAIKMEFNHLCLLVLERKISTRQTREELMRKGVLIPDQGSLPLFTCVITLHIMLEKRGNNPTNCVTGFKETSTYEVRLLIMRTLEM